MVAIAPLSWSKAQEWLTKIENEVDQRDKKKTEKTGEWSRYKLRIMENDALRHLEFLLVYYSVQAIHADHERIGLISHIDAYFSRMLLCSFFAPKTLMQTCNFCVIKGIDRARRDGFGASDAVEWFCRPCITLAHPSNILTACSASCSQHWDYELHEMFRKLFMTGVSLPRFPASHIAAPDLPRCSDSEVFSFLQISDDIKACRCLSATYSAAACKPLPPASERRLGILNIYHLPDLFSAIRTGVAIHMFE